MAVSILKKIFSLFKPSSIFGWKAVMSNYGWRDMFLDSILPVLVSSALCAVMYVNDANIFIQLKHLVGVGISIVPAMVALILAAYTILLTFVIGDKFSLIKGNDEGRSLIQGLNASFAACLFISTISLITMIITSCVANMNIEIKDSNTINYIMYFIISYLLIYSVSILIGVVIDVFNCGQTTLFDD